MRVRKALADEAGFSLVEILVTIVIVGLAFASILGGLVTAISVSDYHRKQATADTVARDAAEVVKNGVTPGTIYHDCAAKGYYALPTPPSGYTVRVDRVEYWNGATPTTGQVYSPTFEGACGVDHGLQLITITVESEDHRASESVQLIKRKLA